MVKGLRSDEHVILGQLLWRSDDENAIRKYALELDTATSPIDLGDVRHFMREFSRAFFHLFVSPNSSVREFAIYSKTPSSPDHDPEGAIFVECLRGEIDLETGRCTVLDYAGHILDLSDDARAENAQPRIGNDLSPVSRGIAVHIFVSHIRDLSDLRLRGWPDLFVSYRELFRPRRAKQRSVSASLWASDLIMSPLIFGATDILMPTGVRSSASSIWLHSPHIFSNRTAMMIELAYIQLLHVVDGRGQIGVLSRWRDTTRVDQSASTKRGQLLDPNLFEKERTNCTRPIASITSSASRLANITYFASNVRRLRSYTRFLIALEQRSIYLGVSRSMDSRDRRPKAWPRVSHSAFDTGHAMIKTLGLAAQAARVDDRQRRCGTLIDMAAGGPLSSAFPSCATTAFRGFSQISFDADLPRSNRPGDGVWGVADVARGSVPADPTFGYVADRKVDASAAFSVKWIGTRSGPSCVDERVTPPFGFREVLPLGADRQGSHELGGSVVLGRTSGGTLPLHGDARRDGEILLG
jgi:hypothetical protein